MFKYVINKSVIIFTVNIISSLFSTAIAYAHCIFYKGYCSQSGLLASSQTVSFIYFQESTIKKKLDAFQENFITQLRSSKFYTDKLTGEKLTIIIFNYAFYKRS
jgi:hypothetical protein